MVIRIDSGSSTIRVVSGGPGPRGASAYEIAVANGFIGTEAEWLEGIADADHEHAIEDVQGLRGELDVRPSADISEFYGLPIESGKVFIHFDPTDSVVAGGKVQSIANRGGGGSQFDATAKAMDYSVLGNDADSRLYYDHEAFHIYPYNHPMNEGTDGSGLKLATPLELLNTRLFFVTKLSAFPPEYSYYETEWGGYMDTPPNKKSANNWSTLYSYGGLTTRFRGGGQNIAIDTDNAGELIPEEWAVYEIEVLTNEVKYWINGKLYQSIYHPEGYTQFPVNMLLYGYGLGIATPGYTRDIVAMASDHSPEADWAADTIRSRLAAKNSVVLRNPHKHEVADVTDLERQLFYKAELDTGRTSFYQAHTGIVARWSASNLEADANGHVAALPNVAAEENTRPVSQQPIFDSYQVTPSSPTALTKVPNGGFRPAPGSGLVLDNEVDLVGKMLIIIAQNGTALSTAEGNGHRSFAGSYTPDPLRRSRLGYVRYSTVSSSPPGIPNSTVYAQYEHDGVVELGLDTAGNNYISTSEFEVYMVEITADGYLRRHRFNDTWSNQEHTIVEGTPVPISNFSGTFPIKTLLFDDTGFFDAEIMEVAIVAVGASSARMTTLGHILSYLKNAVAAVGVRDGYEASRTYHKHKIDDIHGLQAALDEAEPLPDFKTVNGEAIIGTGDIVIPKGEDGTDGVEGASAYDVAVAGGFVGTEAEWLASLVGPPGDKGDTGDASTVPGPKGDGWTGGSYDAGTGVVTFTSDDGLGFTTGDLRGADGTDGTDGIDGTNGVDGADGVSVIITTTTSQATFDAATPGPLEIVVLTNA